MKLFTRYFRINLLATVIIFVLASLAFYLLLRYVSIRQVDDDLRIEQREIESYLARYHKPPEPMSVHDQSIAFDVSPIHAVYQTFHTIHAPAHYREENFRQISFTAFVNNQWLMFRVAKSLEETERLNQSIIAISLVTIIAIFIVSLLINRWLLGRLWKPFYSTLSAMEKYRLGENAAPVFEKTSIHEFGLLNKTLGHFIQDAEKEYTVLREFTENASHELQTPLAVVRSTLDVMMQDEKLNESQSHLLQNAYGAIQKMSKLNESLLLLNKIENHQYSETRAFNFETAVEEKMADWQELWQGRKLTISARLQPALVKMNRELADILLGNLFSNAARHCKAGGHIHISLEKDRFEIANTAVNGTLDPGKLFIRFSKAGQASDQHGLGLSIVKQIMDVSDGDVRYRYQDRNHVFTVHFQVNAR